MEKFAIFITDGENILIQNHKNEWNIPTTELDEGETPEFAVLRILEEDTGISIDDIKSIKYLGEFDDLKLYSFESSNLPILSLLNSVRIQDNNGKSKYKIDEYKIINLEKDGINYLSEDLFNIVKSCFKQENKIC